MWQTASGDMVGDDPADIVSEHLERLSEQLMQRRRTKLALEDLLGHVRLVLTMKADDLLAPGSMLPGASLYADLEIADDVMRVRGTEQVDTQVRNAIDAMCAAITRVYVTFLERRPTASEVCAAIRFVLGPRPDRYLDVGEDARIVRISCE